MNWYCKRFKRIVVSYDDPQSNKLARARCKMWVCPYCANINRKRWRAHIIVTLNKPEFEEKHWCFATITLPRWVHKKATVEERIENSIEFYRKHWDSLMKRLKREYGKFSYIRVIEEHQSGVLHIHFLFSVWLTDIEDHGSQKYSQTFKEHLVSTKFGYINHQVNIVDKEGNKANAGLVTAYITKYMTKTTQAFHDAVHGKRVRRIQTSRDIGSPKDISGNEVWWIKKHITEYDLYIAQTADKDFIDINTGSKITYDDFLDSDIYPSENGL